jgi:hypothetical protein
MDAAVVRKKSLSNLLFFFLHWFLQANIVIRAEYADLSFSCPLRTSCQPICVSNESLCPQSASCGEGTILCADGSCGTVCSSSLLSPCSGLCDSTPVTCARPIDFYENCKQYYSFYEQTEQCVKQKEAEVQPHINFTGFKVCYGLYIIVIASTLLWCAYNQRFRPVDGSTKTLKEVEELGYNQNHNANSTWTQTAYCGSFVGTLIYIIVLISLFGIQVMLAVLTLLYYNHDVQASSSEQELILKAFIVTWMLGFLWSFVLKWPSSIHSLFLRRCLHSCATFVAVYAPTQSTDAKQQRGTSASYITKMKYCLNAFKDAFHAIMSFIFSGVTSSKEVGHITYCRVYQESNCRYFYFRLRRYNYDPSKDEFVPGYWDMGNTVRELLDAKDGLRALEVEERKQEIGPNSIRMKKPRLIRTVTEEFSNSYYTYQNFIIWSVTVYPYAEFWRC